MKRIVLVALLLAPLPAAAQTPYSCVMAILRDVEEVVETIAVPTTTYVTTKRDSKGRLKTEIHESTGERREKSYRLEVEFNGVRYTAESGGNPWNFDPTRLVINDDIGVCLESGKRLIIQRPDGKHFK